MFHFLSTSRQLRFWVFFWDLLFQKDRAVHFKIIFSAFTVTNGRISIYTYRYYF